MSPVFFAYCTTLEPSASTSNQSVILVKACFKIYLVYALSGSAAGGVWLYIENGNDLFIKRLLVARVRSRSASASGGKAGW